MITISSQIQLAAKGGHHIPGTDYSWRHTWKPLTASAARSHFGGHVPARWRPPLLPAPGRPHTIATPQDFHANYLPRDQKRLDSLKSEADRLGREAARAGTAHAQNAAYKAQGKYQSAVDAAVTRARGEASSRAAALLDARAKASR